MKEKPGAILKRVLETLPPDIDHRAFIAWVEQRAKMHGDIDMLREIKAYISQAKPHNELSPIPQEPVIIEFRVEPIKCDILTMAHTQEELTDEELIKAQPQIAQWQQAVSRINDYFERTGSVRVEFEEMESEGLNATFMPKSRE